MTRVALLLPFAVAGGLGLVAPVLARRLPPRHATWLLSAGGGLSALSGLAVLGLLALVLVGQQPEIAREGNWSVAALRAHAPVDAAVAGAALVAVLAAGSAVIAVGVRRGLALLAAHRSCRAVPAATGELVVVADTAAGAYAVPGRPGRIVVAQPLLAALSTAERRALLAHERAHLRHGHHWHLAAVALAAGANPLLLPLRAAASHATERWADEAAAEAVGDRRVAAAALARAALATRPSSAGASPALAAAARAVPGRVEALLSVPPRPRPVLVTIVLTLLLAGAVAAVITAQQTDQVFDLAMRVRRGP